MNIIDLIEKKKQKQSLNQDEIQYFINGYLNGEIEDYQASALLMAIYFVGMDIDETTYLTKAMVDSGEILDLSSLGEFVIDKHSSGGVGDKITMMFMPIVASLGDFKVAKLSGRGLGHTGGTIDKFESIPNFDVNLNDDRFLNQVKKINIALSSQTKTLAPADGKIYALRDVTATVNIIPLIASSIVSKKIASGANYIVLDVKYGIGAFIKSKEEALILAKTMVEVGKRLNKKIIACITDMNMPLGHAVGNSLEIIEAIEFLKGNTPQDLKEITYSLISTIIDKTDKFKTKNDIINAIDDSIKSGKALCAFKTMIEAQNGNSSILDDYSLFGTTKNKYLIKAKKDGFINNIDALKIAKACKLLGAGRVKKDEKIDLNVGIYLNKHYGDKVNENETIATIYYNDEKNLNEALQYINTAFEYTQNKPNERKLVYQIVE